MFCMSANAIFPIKLAANLRWMAACFVFFLSIAMAVVAAPDEEAAERAVVSLVAPLEKAGFDFRADVWERELKPDLGKAVRLQLFKGNDYRVCVAVSSQSGVKIEAHVLDVSGKPVEEKTESKGWGTTLFLKPKHTGVYVVTIRETDGRQQPATVAMIMGYK